MTLRRSYEIGTDEALSAQIALNDSEYKIDVISPKVNKIGKP